MRKRVGKTKLMNKDYREMFYDVCAVGWSQIQLINQQHVSEILFLYMHNKLKELKILKQGDYNRTIGLNPINIASTNSNVPSTASRRLKKKRAISNLEKIEVELQKARVAIKAASVNDPVDDPDYVPLGPMYWNAKVFHR